MTKQNQKCQKQPKTRLFRGVAGKCASVMPLNGFLEGGLVVYTFGFEAKK